MRNAGGQVCNPKQTKVVPVDEYKRGAEMTGTGGLRQPARLLTDAGGSAAKLVVGVARGRG